MKEPLVFTNGCFDLLHIGHIRLLRFAASLGSVTVGINSDQSVRRLKGSKRPITSEVERKEILLSLRFVSDVRIFEEDDPLSLIQELKPDVIVKGADYTLEEVVGHEFARVELFPLVSERSTSRLLVLGEI